MRTNAGPTPTLVNNSKQMEILDSLPRLVRDIIRIAPVCLDVEQIKQQFGTRTSNKKATEQIAGRLIKAIQSNYPDWNLNVRRI